jgi:hypothetical protein
VCQLNKSLYGLKQALWAWYDRFTTYLVYLGLCGDLLLYVDNIVLTASSLELLQHTTMTL